MTYLSYATGYKSGGWDGNQFSSVVSGPFDPEEMTSYEWGVKGDFFDSRVRVELAVFPPRTGWQAESANNQGKSG